VAKKNADGTAPAPRRATPRRTTKRAPAAAPVDVASVTAIEPISSAADMGNVSAESQYQPTYDDIAQKAYERYLKRGGTDGRDFEDWIEAERELATRNGG
jgi:Protein of unknown function (DUF2934)